MTAALHIDFVSDVACPWCAVGLASLQQALADLDETLHVEIDLQPFELNPDLGTQGEDAVAHIMRKYGIDADQSATNRAVIRERAAEVGVTYNTGPGSRIWNTFDAHRLLHWAGAQSRASALTLKQALFRAYFTDNGNVSDHQVLLRVVAETGLEAEQARIVLEGQAYGEEVRRQERHFRELGIQSVPATIINGQYLISGGQPPEAFRRALEKVAREQDDGA